MHGFCKELSTQCATELLLIYKNRDLGLSYLSWLPTRSAETAVRIYSDGMPCAEWKAKLLFWKAEWYKLVVTSPLTLSILLLMWIVIPVCTI